MRMKIPRNQHFILMEILPSESTYQYCCELFYFSMKPLQSVVLRIFQLYNPELWEQYKRQKAMMTVHKAVSTSLEYHLFHETTIRLEHLAANGLDSKLSRYAGILGYGTYFSLHAKTASLMNLVYNPDFGHVIVLARVLVGENTVGRPGLQAPPFKPDGQQFEFCVNNTDRPTRFVIFKEKYSFPHFIILYKHFRDSVHLVF
uniref:TCDD-inducible poly [ADP-ribose] polymerase-like n=1 Tax=Phascolarctos cinereus TaxID=38626 RepID=A0A6P5IR09_PHACI|nr:TCDD-inducible poly [ADP-ribose] polymerase-like [Phascolarctos cinereus]XP_020824570.1 TCDD-inducible poly [ADP-ribose] polymerase-like [Phascolarctos cinereus]